MTAHLPSFRDEGTFLGPETPCKIIEIFCSIKLLRISCFVFFLLFPPRTRLMESAIKLNGHGCQMPKMKKAATRFGICQLRLPNPENSQKKMSRKHYRMVLSCKWYCPAEGHCPVTVNDENTQNLRCLVNGQAPASKWTA